MNAVLLLVFHVKKFCKFYSLVAYISYGIPQQEKRRDMGGSSSVLLNFTPHPMRVYISIIFFAISYALLMPNVSSPIFTCKIKLIIVQQPPNDFAADWSLKRASYSGVVFANGKL